MESAEVKTASGDGVSEAVRYNVLQLTADQEYVLFALYKVLHSKADPARHGDTIWTHPGEPGIAQLDLEGRLTLIATDRYKTLGRPCLCGS